MDLKIITSFKIGDRVKRIQGRHANGMKTGDIGTIFDISQVSNEIHIRLKEYPNGWHYVNNFIKTDYNLKYNKNAQRKKSRVQRLEEELKGINSRKDKIEEEISTIRDNQIEEIKGYDNVDMMSGSKFIKMFKQGNSVICRIYDENNKIIGKGKSTPCSGDEFDLKIGTNIAYDRAMINMFRRHECETIRNTFK
jgi:hypothetical protein